MGNQESNVSLGEKNNLDQNLQRWRLILIFHANMYFMLDTRIYNHSSKEPLFLFYLLYLLKVLCDEPHSIFFP